MRTFTIEEYITSDFFELLGLDELTDEKKQELLDSMNKTVLARVYAHIYDDLAEAEQEELDHLSPDNLMPFLEQRGYDLGKLVVDEALRYRVEVVQMFQLASSPLEQPQLNPAA